MLWIFTIVVFDLKIYFLIEKSISGFKKPEKNMKQLWKIVKSTENANLLPSNPVAYQPRGSLCYKL